MKRAVITFGRFQPPTLAHGALFDYMKVIAAGREADAYVFTSTTVDKKKNPLDYETKLLLLNKMFPSMSFVNEPDVKDPFGAICRCGRAGYQSVILVAGADRINKYADFLKYINHPDPTKAIPGVIDLFLASAGDRDPDSDSVHGVSATKARDAAKNNDLKAFADMMPRSISSETVVEIYTTVRRGLGIHGSN